MMVDIGRIHMVGKHECIYVSIYLWYDIIPKMLFGTYLGISCRNM